MEPSYGLGQGTNNYAEIKALHFLLCWLTHLGITSFQIFGDSLNIIKWFNKEFICQNILLSPILEEQWLLKDHFTYHDVCHIYRECNAMTDLLSKEGVQRDLGSWRIREIGPEGPMIMDHPPFV